MKRNGNRSRGLCGCMEGRQGRGCDLPGMTEQPRTDRDRKRQAGWPQVQPTAPAQWATGKGEYPTTRQPWWRRFCASHGAIGSLVRKLRPVIGGHLPFTGESLLPELIAVGCFLALLWASIAIVLSHEYRSAETTAVQSTGNLARAFEESTRRTIGQIDQVLLSARAFYAAQGARFDFNEWARTQTLPDKMTAAIGMADSRRTRIRRYAADPGRRQHRGSAAFPGAARSLARRVVHQPAGPRAGERRGYHPVHPQTARAARRIRRG